MSHHLSIKLKAALIVFVVMISSIDAQASFKTWCKWLFSASENPLEWADKSKMTLTPERREAALLKAGPEFKKLISTADV